MLLNLSITLISLLASSAVSCINIRVKLTYSLASYCRFVLNSHPQQNIEPLYSYIYQNSAIYAKGKQFYLFDLLLFCYLLFFILYLKMTVFSQWLKGRNIWFWIFGWITIYIIWLYRNIIDNGVIPGFLVVFFVVRWLFMFVVWITDCAFWNNTALWWIFGIIFICCFGVFEVSLPRLFFPHVSCQRRITPTFPVCQGFSLEKPSGHWASPWNPTVQASINIAAGRIILSYLKWENASDKYFSSNCNKVFKYNLSSLKTFENHVMTFSTNGPEETLLCLPLWRGPYSSVSFIFCRSCASLFSFCTGDEIQL